MRWPLISMKTPAVPRKINRTRVAGAAFADASRCLRWRLAHQTAPCQKAGRGSPATREFSMGHIRRTSPAVDRVESFRNWARTSGSRRTRSDARTRSNETCVRFRHDNRGIEQMIEMSVSHQDRIHPAVAGREMAHSISDAKCPVECAEPAAALRRSHAREIRIDKQCVTFEIRTGEAVRAEISHAHSVVPRCGRITDNQVSIGAESCTKGLRRESKEEEREAQLSNAIHV